MATSKTTTTKPAGGTRSSAPVVRDIPDTSGPTAADQMGSGTYGEAEAARIAAGHPVEDATEATEAEVPAENIAHIGDATLPSREEAAAALDRATASLGKRKKR